MRSSVKWAAALIVLAMLAPYRAGALGLGEIKLNSYLNQPLKAEIPVKPSPGDDLAGAQVTLASQAAFAKAGIERPDVLDKLTFTLEKGADGPPRIRVTSTAPIKEPFLDFIVQLSWSKGRMLREYTVLLDPPVTVDEPAPAVQPVETAAAASDAGSDGRAASASQPDTGGQPAAGAQPAAPVLATRSIAPQLTKDSYGPTQRSDTLWSIATAMRPEGVSVQQAMLALVKQNPDAFYGGNVNALKAGYILRLPDMNAMTAVAQADAVREVQQQYREWLDARQAGRVPGEVAGHPGGKIARGGRNGAEPQGRLKLLPAEAALGGAAGQGTGGAGDEKLAAALEDSEAQKQTNAQLKSQLNELNDQVQSLQRLLSLKDDTLAALQQKLAQLQGQPADAAATQTAQPAAAAAVGQPAAPGQPAAGAQPDTQAQAQAQPAAPAAKPAPAAPVVKAKPKAVKPPVAVHDSLWQNPKVLAMGGIVVLLVGALVWGAIRRRQMDSDGFVPVTESGSDAPAADEAAVPEAAAAAPAGSYVPTGGDLLETEVDEIDPLAEADVYMAYRRFQQAEELLKGAIEHEPQRQELRLKLLEVYAASDNAPAFVAAAEGFHNEFGGSDNPLWVKVTAMGRDVQPDHPLFSGGGGGLTTAAEAAVEAAGDTDLDLGMGDDLDNLFEDAAAGGETDAQAAFGETAEGGADEVMAMSPAAAGDEHPAVDGAVDEESPAAEDDSGVIEFESGLNLGLDKPTAAAAPTETAATGNEIDFDLGLDKADDHDGAPAADGMDGGLPLQGQASDDAVAAAPAAGGEDDLDLGLDFSAMDGGDRDLDNFFEGLDAADDEEHAPGDALGGQEDVGTKLDLAKAFMEMGDHEGAREILKEVMDMGDDDQKREAQGLLQNLSADA